MTFHSEEHMHPNPRVAALAAAYREGRLVVSADDDELARVRRAGGIAIDVRDVADHALRSRRGVPPLRPVAA